MIDNCKSCQHELNSDNWYPSNRRKNYRVCKACVALQRKTWIKANPDTALEMIRKAQNKFKAKPEYPEVARQQSKRWREENPEKSILRMAKFRAKQKNLSFSITTDDIVIPHFCPVLGIPITKNGAKNSDNLPSLDRIIPEKGYIPGNVAVISNRANMLKNSGSLNELEKIVSWLKKVTK